MNNSFRNCQFINEFSVVNCVIVVRRTTTTTTTTTATYECGGVGNYVVASQV